MRQTHKVGEKLFVDYSGDGVPIVDPQTGEIHRAQIFVAVLGASGYTYAEATLSQTLPDWIGSSVLLLLGRLRGADTTAARLQTILQKLHFKVGSTL